MKKIGFKLKEEEPTATDFSHSNEFDILPTQIEKLRVLMEIANDIDSKMQEQSKSIVKDEPFWEINASTLANKLNKIYIKYYEEI
jgi:hypothetical protein